MCVPFLSAFLYFCAYSPFTIRNFRNALRKLRFIFWNISFQVKRKFRRDLKNEANFGRIKLLLRGKILHLFFFSVLSCSFCRFSHEYDNSVTSVGAFRRCHRRTWLKPTCYFHFEIMGRSKQQGTRHFLKIFIIRTKNKHLHYFSRLNILLNCLKIQGATTASRNNPLLLVLPDKSGWFVSHLVGRQLSVQVHFSHLAAPSSLSDTSDCTFG